jgi:hypothetical protein
MKGETVMKRLLGTLLLLLAITAASAQEFVINPLGIVVNPKPGFDVQVSLNKRGGPDGIPSYRIGESIEISVTVSESSYVYLFNVKANGQIVQILPNEVDADGRNNYLRAGETKRFPPPNGGYLFEISGPRGLDKVIAVASRSQLDTRTLASFASGDQFASSSIGESGFAQALGIIVRPIPQTNWVTATTRFYVGDAPVQPPSTGTLTISSSPSGAEVYVDDNFAGYTPVSYATRPGRHDIRVQLGGYETYRESVNLQPRENLRIDASLIAIRRTGTASFTSSPGGADVYIDNQFQGTTPLRNLVLDAGSYTARFTLGGYQDETVRFQVDSGSNRTVNANLRARTGSIRITANVGGAQVFLNGVASGTIPSGTGVLELPGLQGGTYEVVVIAPNYATFLNNVRVSAGNTSDVRVRQERR